MTEIGSDFQISYQSPFNSPYWLITNHTMDTGDMHYELRITRYHRGHNEDKNDYKFYDCDYSLGLTIELVTQEKYDWLKQNVLDHEGSLDDCTWYKEGTIRVMNSWEEDKMKKLIRRWEAVCELVNPHNT